MQNACRSLVGKPDLKILFERQTRRTKDNIKSGIKEIDYEFLDSIHLVLDSDQERALNEHVMKFRVG